ncbi:hypothetical protein Y1Q_0013445 [Alligator mississippiensis]|uniref:Uncharacterized protein n=1 Tax=Alligator mississippiensis TaxID=8496 RepID=A0A151MSI1_ALLMI|nr:hypothetical protein Y1Q_0013445 [Alligator mississippiensis]
MHPVTLVDYIRRNHPSAYGSHLSMRDFDCLSATTSESSAGTFSSSAATNLFQTTSISSKQKISIIQ